MACLSMSPLFVYWQVVTLEQPELEERHHDLVTSIATDQKKLLDIEDQILKLLNDAGSGVEVLDDEVCQFMGEVVILYRASV